MTRWRNGTQVGRTIYVCEGEDPKGKLIGLMDTPELAKRVVDAVNGSATISPAVARHAWEALKLALTRHHRLRDVNDEILNAIAALEAALKGEG